MALGGAIQLQCPENTMGCWSRVGTGGRLEAVGPGPGLALEDVLYQDAGEYRCMAGRKGNYDKWRSEINVDVTVKGKINCNIYHEINSPFLPHNSYIDYDLGI